jgi:hypothetical protein
LFETNHGRVIQIRSKTFLATYANYMGFILKHNLDVLVVKLGFTLNASQLSTAKTV